MTNEQLAEIEARCKAATPEPWSWWFPSGAKGPSLAHPRHGLLLVMDAIRVGMQGGTIRFAQRTDVMGGLMRPAATFIHEKGGHRADWASIDNADAQFIEHARSDVPALVAEVRRLRALLAVTESGDA